MFFFKLDTGRSVLFFFFIMGKNITITSTTTTNNNKIIIINVRQNVRGQVQKSVQSAGRKGISMNDDKTVG